MCGIVGYIGPTDKAPKDLDKALALLKHRGPDDSGTWANESGMVRLGHTRLSIVDLSEAGAQPMRDEISGNVLVFNGEIYNHPELREELIDLGVRFKGHSDTETLLQAYGVWGTSVFERLRGMFALALWDNKSRHLVLARDMLGIKPLYFAESEANGFYFASEVRALLALKPASLSHEGVATYLQRGSCAHEKLLFEGINEFPAGCFAQIRLNQTRLVLRRFWSVKDEISASDERADVVEIRDLLEDAVRSHLLSDVPVACFLSGGIDSSIITALAARSMEPRKLSTFSVGFTEAAFDESKFARQMAELYGTDHHHITLSDAEKLDFMSRAVESMDLPSTDAINTYIVSDYVARNGFKVVLSGLGADELFGGYPIFRDYSMVRTVAGTPAWLRSLVRVTGKARHLLDDIPPEKDGELLSIWWRRIWPGRKLQTLGFDVPGFKREPSPLLRDAFAELSWGEISHYMRDTLLRDSDAMSMAHSLELRVPFLDTLLVSRVLAYPAREKFNPKRPKDLLLRATQDLIPEEIWNRPKMGFTLPMRTWMLGPLRDYCRDGLNVLPSTSILASDKADKVWTEFERNALHWAAPWSLVVLGHYLRKNTKSTP
jgi:asparagine synthase (glutamine-hydrolysing)